ncbi:MAG: DUF1080 domain-containing protein [Planctomycetales bacterium]|nr:DUF1080 domain-containing protein [Planctomycetales bacterium]
MKRVFPRVAVLAFSLLLASAAGATAAEGEHEVFTDPAKAGPDFDIQGEYSGEFLAGDSGEAKFGLQVIALGDGKFRGVAFFGGLPGDGWDGFSRLAAEGKLQDDGSVVLEASEGKGIVKDGKISIRSNDGQELGVLEKVHRESPTLGAEAPEGAIVLFDGTGTDAFEGATMTDDGLLNVGCRTKQKFQDFQLHIEFRTPFKPTARGQERGNSGVYLQDRYECQVLDSFGLEGEDNECGGIYHVKRPRENLCYPPLSWQTYDIDFTAAKFDDDGNKLSDAVATIKHNGFVIHKNLELKTTTPGGATDQISAEPGALFLQDHGNPVAYRNVWIVEK